jgi:hypothetical protein
VLWVVVNVDDPIAAQDFDGAVTACISHHYRVVGPRFPGRSADSETFELRRSTVPVTLARNVCMSSAKLGAFCMVENPVELGRHFWPVASKPFIRGLLLGYQHSDYRQHQLDEEEESQGVKGTAEGSGLAWTREGHVKPLRV